MKTHLNTIFRWCNDVNSMRHCYSDLLSLEETFFRDDEEHGWLTYQLGEVQLVFMRSDASLPVLEEFAKQPGYPAGDLVTTAWVIGLDRPSFFAAAERLAQGSLPLHQSKPVESRPGHLQLLFRDPMGHTIELYTTTEEADDNG